MSKIRKKNITGGDLVLQIRPFWKIPSLVVQSGCCYGYCDSFYDWWI